jgi:hypothetical protein
MTCGCRRLHFHPGGPDSCGRCRAFFPVWGCPRTPGTRLVRGTQPGILSRHRGGFSCTPAPARGRRSAFTLIELHQVYRHHCGVIGLLLPPSRKCETASRLRCTNNLKQLVLGTHNYTTRDRFPAAYGAPGLTPGWGRDAVLPSSSRTTPHHGVATVRFGGSAPALSNAATQTKLVIFRCPSDTGPDLSPSDSTTGCPTTCRRREPRRPSSSSIRTWAASC